MDKHEIVRAVRSVVGNGKTVPLHYPSIGQAEIESVAKIVRDDPIGYRAIDKLAKLLSETCGTEFALVVNSGTAALHLALLSLGVKADDEVLVPALTFVATANAVSHCGAVVNLVDSREYDFAINPYKLQRYLMRICERRSDGTFNRQSGRKISAMITVDLMGTPCDIDRLRQEAGRWGIPVIADASQALGSKYKDRACGSCSFVNTLSFNNNKIVTTNGGGALLTDDPWTFSKAFSLATTARVKHAWRMEHAEVAYNYRMGNVNAALGLPQLQRLEQLVAAKTRLHGAYAEKLGLSVILPEKSRSNYWLNVLMLPEPSTDADEMLKALHEDGIQARAMFTPLVELPMYKHCPRDNLEESMSVFRRAVCLPSSPYLGEKL